MRHPLLLLILLPALAARAPAVDPVPVRPEGEVVRLFNGKDLTG
jgi:hypothetical protein